MQRYKVVVAEQAEQDILSIGIVILEISGYLKSAEKWVDKINARIKSLAVFPERYPRFVYNLRYRSTNVGKYKIIYKVTTAVLRVDVLRVVYARRNLAQIRA